MSSPTSNGDPSPIHVDQRKWSREVVKLAAALVVFALVAGLLVVVLGGGDEQGGSTGSAADATPTDAVATVLVTPQLVKGTMMVPTPSAEDPALAATVPAEVRQSSRPLENLTLEEAQSRIPFQIVVPDPVPEGLVLGSIAIQPMTQSDELAVILTYAPAGEQALPVIVLTRSRLPYADMLWHDAAIPEDGLTTTTRAFGETTVTRRDLTMSMCFGMTFDEWEQSGVQFATLIYPNIFPIDTALIDQLIAATLQVAPPVPVAPKPVADAPAPNALGDYCGLSVAQTRELADFPFAMPDTVPAPFDIRSVDLLTVPISWGSYMEEDGTPVPTPTLDPAEVGKLDRAVVRFSIAGGDLDDMFRVSLNQGTSSDMFEGVGFHPSFGSPEATLIIDGVEVERWSLDPPGQTVPSNTDAAAEFPDIVWYNWRIGDVQFILEAHYFDREGDPLTEAAVEELIAAIINAALEHAT